MTPGSCEVKYTFPNSSYFQRSSSLGYKSVCRNVSSLTTYEYKCKLYSFILACVHSGVSIGLVGGEYLVMKKEERVFVLMRLVF